MNIALIGPSGAGKGTHIPGLQQRFGMLHISAGDVFRSHVKSRTALGYLAGKYIDQGELIPDEIVEAMLQEELRKFSIEKGVILDGFPRTIHQARFVDGLLQQAGHHLDAVIYLRVGDEEICKRLAGRLICQACLYPYHKTFAPFKNCPHHRCQGEHLFQREDDKAQLIRTRLRVFHRITGPLAEFYHESRRLIVVDGEGAPHAVRERLEHTIESLRVNKAHFATSRDVDQLQEFNNFVPRLLKVETIKRALDLALIGPPGAGKGTQAEELSKHFHLRHFATGSLFREHVRLQTDLGKIAKSYLDHGDLVPDDVTVGMIAGRLSQPDTSNGFVLDGYPRTLAQAQALENMLHELHRELAGVLYLKVSDNEIQKRFSGRLLCRQCLTAYHIEFRPPGRTGLCDLCSSPLFKPDDDNPEVVKARLEAFHRQTEPLIEFYKDLGILIEINAEGKIAEVTNEAIAKVKKLAGSPHFRNFHPITE